MERPAEMAHDYYSGRRARLYTRRWRVFTMKTLAAAVEMIDFTSLRAVLEREGRLPRVLDLACGTGELLKQVIERVPELEAYGVDASPDMLAQARLKLKDWPQVRLEQRRISGDGRFSLTFAPASIDLITCTNALHDIAKPVPALAEMAKLLASHGQFVIEDYARREPPFPWAIVEWLAKHIETGHVRAYTLAEARSLCAQAGLHVTSSRAFVVNWLWHGWVLSC